MRLFRVYLAIASILLSAVFAEARTLEVDGAMRSDVNFELTQDMSMPGGARRVTASFVVPQEFISPTFVQRIEDYNLRFSPKPDSRETDTDVRGNRIITATWNKPPDSVRMTVTFTARNQTLLKGLGTTAGFPVRGVPKSVTPYLEPSAQVQSNDPAVVSLARRLTAGAGTEYEAVERIAGHVVDNLRYVNPPRRYDALYSLKTGKGNCQNYSHLCAALLRASGIPARIVNGYTLARPYKVREGNSIFTFKSADGRHSWIEVWFPDLGWVPFDAQKTSFFVANRFIRVETGVDNKETVNDGRIRYVRASKTSPRPTFKSGLGGEFASDTVALDAGKGPLQTSKLLLFPQVDARVQVAAAEPVPAKPVKPEYPKKSEATKPFKPIPAKPAPGKSKDRPRLVGPVVFGNLDFPENVDFTDYGTVKQVGEDQFEVTRNFLVESAEYVTTRATQYAQVFQVEEAMTLESISLALHRYGGGGMLWVDLYADRDGRPGKLLAASGMVGAKKMSLAPGYRWQTFDFSAEHPVLGPGHYWIGLGFAGDLIVNWFYTYGKSVGPLWGTRNKDVFEQDWSSSLNYEFNYRIKGAYLPLKSAGKGK